MAAVCPWAQPDAAAEKSAGLELGVQALGVPMVDDLRWAVQAQSEALCRPDAVRFAARSCAVRASLDAEAEPGASAPKHAALAAQLCWPASEAQLKVRETVEALASRQVIQLLAR
jgi:hypothetical protein